MCKQGEQKQFYSTPPLLTKKVPLKKSLQETNPKVFLAEPLLDVLHIIHQGLVHWFDGCVIVSI